MTNNCLFCSIDPTRIIAQNDTACTVYDGYPVTELHTLVIPKRHAATYFDLTNQERDACYQLLAQSKTSIELEDTSVTGFNIGMNNGESAGQTIFHCHIHLIPRRDNDTDSPRGGVRGVIPSKQSY
jgi:diadenosine tetraphosphate (Ap4A) HIT family hydrolase